MLEIQKVFDQLLNVFHCIIAFPFDKIFLFPYIASIIKDRLDFVFGNIVLCLCIYVESNSY